MVQPVEDGAGSGGARRTEAEEGAGRLEEGGAVEPVQTFGCGGDGGWGRRGGGRGDGGGCGGLLLGRQEGMERPVDDDDGSGGGA